MVDVTTCSTLAVPIDNPKAERKPCSLLQILAVTQTGQPTVPTVPSTGSQFRLLSLLCMCGPEC